MLQHTLAKMGLRMPALAGGTILPILLYACSGSSVVNPDTSVLGSLSYREPDKLLIVDCMVPGRIKKLGNKMVIVEPRKPQKLAAGLCEIKGGEYVAYDRANLSTALTVWLESAQLGDLKAQTYVGEIYEKGLGVQPDYEKAFYWYRKAADQGNARAKLNLAYLYEKGLGVPEDKAMALNLYRSAAGLEEDELEFVSMNRKAMTEARQRIDQLQTQVEQSDQRTLTLRRKLDAKKEALREHRSRLSDARKVARRLQFQLLESSNNATATVDSAVTQKQPGQKSPSDIEHQQNRIDTLEQERQVLKQQLQQLKQRETQLDGDLKAYQSESNVLRNQADESHQALLLERQLLQRARAKLKQARMDITAKDPLLQSNTEEIRRLDAAILDGEEQVAILLARITQLGSSSMQQQERLVATEAKSTQLQLQLENNNREVESLGNQLRQAKRREVSLVAEMASLEIKLETRQLDAVTLRKELQRKNTEITKLNMQLENLEGKVTSLSGELGTAWVSDINFGSYHALIIGNSDYNQLDDLPTSKADAEWVEDVLKNHYGFNTRMLTDANRAEIIQALAMLAGELRENDNLLVFYAGHGYLDKAGRHGYWQPVDAQPDNPHSWISDDQISDFLSNLKSKHVLVVADSVYSVDWLSTSTKTPTVPTNVKDRRAFRKWLQVMSRARTRMVLTSGGLEPVTRNDNGGHSVFAQAFLTVLQENDRILPGSQLYYELYQQVTLVSGNSSGNGKPRYAPIRFAGHQAGEFFFKRQVYQSHLDSAPMLAVQNVATTTCCRISE